MSERIKSYIWTIVGIVLLMFSGWFVKNSVASAVIGLFASCLMAEQFMAFLKHSKGQARTWWYVGIAAFLVNALINLLLLSF